MTRRAHWGTPLLLLAPCGAWALGLGDIELRSALNQPLDADIELVSATPEELANLRVALASPETFERYGLDRPGFLGRLIFSVARVNAGRPVIRVSSVEPITEPFVTVLVEATWARGRLLREYTVLLDPPVMLPREAAVEPIQPPAARVPEPATPAAPIERPSAAAPTPAPTPAPAASEPPVTAPVTAPVTPPQPAPTPSPRPPVEGSSASSAYGPVQRGETLWGIASRYRSAGVTMNQMMVAIYRANPAAFQGNMNLLRQGATLELPSDAAITAIGAGEATQEAIAQTAAWQGAATEQQARLRLLPPEVETAPAVGAGAAPSPGASVTPSPATTPATASSATPPAASERILSIEDEELSNLQQLAEQPAVAEVEPAPATEPAAADGMVEAGVDLEAEEIFADETDLEDTDAAATAAETPAVEEEVIEAVEEPVAPARGVSTQVVSSQAEPSLLSRVLGWLTMPLVWMIAGLVALVGAAAVYLRSRQAEGEDMTGRWEALDADIDEDLESREATERLRSKLRVEDEPIVVEEQHTRELPQPDTEEVFFDPGVGGLDDAEDDASEDLLPAVDLDDDDTVDIAATASKPASKAPSKPAGKPASKPAPEATMSSQTVINLDQADPIAEADFHMAYGLYDQAADLVSKALETDPDSRALRLKLLEVYFVWGNREAFLDTARILRTSIGSKPDSDWDKVVIMGKQICPEESLFADAAAVADSVDLDLAAGDSPDLDLAFEDQGGSAMDLDLGGDEDVTIELAESGEDSDIIDIGDGFDIGEATAAGVESAFFDRAQDSSAKTSPNLDIDGETQEAPTLETLGPDAPTMESPALDTSDDDSAELPTLRQPGLVVDDDERDERSEQTAEIDLDDLGLDVDELNELANDSTGKNPLLGLDDEDADVLSATGVTQVLSAGDEFDGRKNERDDDDAVFARTEVLQPRKRGTDEDTGELPGVGKDADDDFGLDIDLDELSAALDGGDTVEQPSVGYGNRRKGGIDLDVGFNPLGSNDPTATEQMTPLDAQTLTEVGTKLDLARAYIDMGDPEGARSILEEVIDEGDSSQQREARGLIEAL